MTTDVRADDVAILRGVKQAICEVWNRGPRETRLSPHTLADEQRLFDTGDGRGDRDLQLDSVDALEVALRIEELFGVGLPEAFEPEEVATPARIAALVRRLKEGDRWTG